MIVESPAAKSCENGRSDCSAIRNPLPTSNRKAPMIATVPIRPSSSPMAAKMKSDRLTGMMFGVPSPIPRPANPPLPNANRLWVS